jgi:hypothetical protein
MIMQRTVKHRLDFELSGRAIWIVEFYASKDEDEPEGTLTFEYKQEADIAARKWLNNTVKEFSDLRLTSQQMAVV